MNTSTKFYLRLALLAVIVSFAFVPNAGLAASHPPGIEVNSYLDEDSGDGVCTLREAIMLANKNSKSGRRYEECTSTANPDLDTIYLPAGEYILTRTDSGNEDSSSKGDLDILDDLTIVVEGGGATITAPDTGFKDRIFHVFAGSFNISNVAIMNGNVVKGSGGGVRVEPGASMTLTNATVSGNTAKDSGGAFYVEGILNLSNVTVTNNNAPDTGGLINTGITNIKNSIFSNNANGNCDGSLTSNGYNISNDNSCEFDNATDYPAGSDSLLSPLSDNGGSTLTHALNLGSPPG